MALHGGRIAFAPECFVGDGKDLPDLSVERAPCTGAFRAYRRILRVTVMEQVLRRENIRALSCGRCLTIGGKLCEKVVVVSALL